MVKNFLLVKSLGVDLNQSPPEYAYKPSFTGIQL